MAACKLTKAQLLERIAQVEAQCAEAIRERDALLIQQRPSRETQRPAHSVNGVTVGQFVTHYTDRMGNIWEKTRAPGSKIATSRIVGSQQ